MRLGQFPRLPRANAKNCVKNQRGENGQFDVRMRGFETTLDSVARCRVMAASNEVRRSGISMKNLYIEYTIVTMFLVSTFIDDAGNIQLRVHIRSELISGNLTWGCSHGIFHVRLCKICC